MGDWVKHTTERAALPLSKLSNSQTPKMDVVTGTDRWGMEPVREVFGVMRRAALDVVFNGELLRDIETGQVFRFRGRSDNMIVLEET